MLLQSVSGLCLFAHIGVMRAAFALRKRAARLIEASHFGEALMMIARKTRG
jgi:hypothetical protein